MVEAYNYLRPLRDAFRGSGELMSYFGYLCFKLGLYGESLEAYKQADFLGEDMNVPMGLVYEELNLPHLAEERYLQAIAADPADINALIDLGTLLNAENESERALIYLQTAAGLDAKLNWQLADALLQVQGVEAAIEALNKALDAGEERALVDLVELTDQGLDISDIKSMLMRAAKAGSTVAMSDLVSYMVEAGRYSEAVEVGRGELLQGHELVLGPLAAAYENLGDMAIAEKYYKDAVKAGQGQYAEDVQRLRDR
ncbi:hypothetical protein ACPEEZ_00210 [Frigoribacterium sp. 2-23]|uniref:tetratricopeptide repeat protein n=1 Tax=Frigoribacterium sp. 2-23 TaxID=3415006 RepID=UPI003C6F71D3